MGLNQRIVLYKKIEEIRNHPLIVYVTSQRSGAQGFMAGDVIPEFIDQLQSLPNRKSKLDLLIESSGGDALVGWRVISLIREKIKKVSILIPYSAFSAATLLALGGDEIVMGKYGCLGPIDPQMKVRKKDGSTDNFAYQDIISYLDFVGKEAGLTEQAHIENAFKILCDQVEPSVLGASRRASSLSVTMAERLLQTHMVSAEEKIQATSIAKSLNESYFSHGHALGRSEAKDIGLNIINAEENLEKLMWNIHEDIENDLNVRVPFHPIETFLSNPDAGPYLQSPPPLHLPPQVPQQMTIQILQNYINQQLQVNIPDVTVNLTHALVESQRHASAFQTRSKILLVRTPDLRFTASMVQLQGNWNIIDIPDSDERERGGDHDS